ncbi:uncharacterized protein LOC110846295 [Folsomia candida]|uniref:uncharacterized protein LOC110846295 n=1 Tax=Folsomia candida TaxID=158441 RepID=UPI000B908B1A|nr:uncharacterized protein LOC110846295 [Folsomia candida]
MDQFVIRLSATPSTSTTTACTSSTVDSPPPSPAEQPPVKKAKPSVKVTPPQREISVDWRSRVILSDDDEVGFLNSQEEFENLYSEGPPTPSSSAILPTPSRHTQSTLFTVRKQIFNHLQEKYPLIEFTFETVESTAEYKDLMELWNKHFKKFEKSDPWKAASPPGVTFLHDNQPVGVKYVGERLFYKVKKEGEKFGWKTSVGTKCRVENCPEKSHLDGYCYRHSTVKREIWMMRDVANLDKVNMALVQPELRKGKFTDLGFNLCLRGAHYDDRAIGQYLAKFPTAWFVIEKRWEYLSEESTRKFQSLGILMSLMVSFHNSVATKPAEQIKFINCDIYTKSANLDDVNKTLALNNMGFEITDANNSLNFANHIIFPQISTASSLTCMWGIIKRVVIDTGKIIQRTVGLLLKEPIITNAKNPPWRGLTPRTGTMCFKPTPPRSQQKRV